MIKGLVFDLDGVITETAKLHFLAWSQEVSKLGINYTEADNETLKGLNRIDTLKAIIKLKNHPLMSDAELTAIATSKNETYVNLLQTNLSKADVLPNINEILALAKQKNLKLAIASSSFNAPLILEKIGLKHYFDYIVNPGTIQHGKPNPEIFSKAVEGIHLQPHECLGFEDAVAGIEGLKAARLITVGVTYGIRSPIWKQADYLFETTADIDLSKILQTHQND